MTDLIDSILWFVLYSFAGWVYETLLALAVHRRFLWKNFLQGPFCPVYGFGALAVIWLLSPFQGNIPLLFVTGALVTCTVEYSTAWFLETVFHHREWDYSPRKWNLQGRVCALGALVFGAFSVILIEWVQPALARLTYTVPARTMAFWAGALSLLMVVDFTITFQQLWLARTKSTGLAQERTKPDES